MPIVRKMVEGVKDRSIVEVNVFVPRQCIVSSNKGGHIPRKMGNQI